MASASDNFNRADENPLSGGGNWTTTGATAPKVLSNQLRPEGSPIFSRSRYTGVTWANDHKARQTLITFVQDCGGPSVRQSASGHYFITGQGSGTDLVLYIDSPIGTFTELDRQVGLSIAANDVFETEANGTTLTGRLNAVAQVSATDSTLASGSAGTSPYGNSGSGATWDDWSAEDLAPPAFVPYWPSARSMLGQLNTDEVDARNELDSRRWF